MREGRAGDDHVLGTEPELDFQQVAEAAKEETGADEEHEREGELGHDEGVVQPPAPSAVARPAALPDPFLEIDARGAEGRGEAEQHARRQRHTEGEEQDLRIEPDRVGIGEALHEEAAHGPHRPRAEDEADRGAPQGQEQALHQQLAPDPEGARAETAAHGDLAVPDGGPREKQVGDVRAGDEQHHPHGAQEDQQGRLHLSDQAPSQRLRIHDRLGRLGRRRVGPGLSLPVPPEVVVQPCDFAGRLARGSARGQPGHRRQAPAVEALRIDAQRNPQLRVTRCRGEAEARQHDPDHGPGPAIHHDGPPTTPASPPKRRCQRL